LADLLKDEVVIRAGRDLGEEGRLKAQAEGHSRDDYGDMLFQDLAKQIELEAPDSNQGAAIFNRRFCSRRFQTAAP
jgi:hypothetical protein